MSKFKNHFQYSKKKRFSTIIFLFIDYLHYIALHEVMEAEITEKKKKDRPRKLGEECIKKDLK